MESSSSIPPSLTFADVNPWVALKRHWIPSVVVAGLIFAGMAYRTLNEPGVYRSEALILVANKTSIPIVREQANDSQEIAEMLPTEIEILQSPTLLNRAIAKLEPAYRNIPVWQIQRSLSLTQPEDTNILAVAYEDTDGVRAKAILDAIVATYITYSEDSRRSPVTNAIQFIDDKLPEAKTSLKKSSTALTAFRVKHNLDNPENNVSVAYGTKEALQKTLNDAEVELKQLEKRNQELQRQISKLGQNPDTAITDTVLSQDSTYQALLKELTSLEIQYQIALTRFTADHPDSRDLKRRRDEMQRLLNERILQIQGRSRSVNPLGKNEVGAVQQNLSTQLLDTQVNINVQKKRLGALQQQLARANTNLQKMLLLQQDYKELERQYRFNAEMVDNFLAKLQELRVQEAQDIFTWKLIESPNLPTIPIERSRVRGLVLGALAGALGGVAVAYFLERINRTIKEVREVKEATGLPILAILPEIKDDPSIVSSLPNPLIEATRSLALTLCAQNPQGKGKTIAITSTEAGEGKTTLAYYLALALTELEERVLLVDANLANPSLHQVLSLDNSFGLTSVLATDRSWQSLIQPLVPAGQRLEELVGVEVPNPEPSPVAMVVSTKELDVSPDVQNGNDGEIVTRSHREVLTAGPVGNNSFSLLVSGKMQWLLEQWRQNYDYVLVDTSALSGLADAQSLTTKVDEVLFVVRLQGPEKEMVTEALDILKRNHARIAGTVVTNMSRRIGSAKNQDYNPFST